MQAQNYTCFFQPIGSHPINKLAECTSSIEAQEQIKRKKELISEKKREYYKKLSPEKKEERKLKSREYYKKVRTEEEFQKRHKERNREWRQHRKTTQTQESRDLQQKQNRECYKQLSPEKKEEKRKKWREIYHKLTPEKLEKRRQWKREYYKKKHANKSGGDQKPSNYCQNVQSEVIKENLNYCEGMKPQSFCYMCEIHFFNNTALLAHITRHVTLPSVILSRIDKRERVFHIKKKDEDMCTEIPQHVVYIKTEPIEYDDDAKPGLKNTHVNIKKEIEVDGLSFHTGVNNESQMNKDVHNILQNVVYIKTEQCIEYDEGIKPELSNTHGIYKS